MKGVSAFFLVIAVLLNGCSGLLYKWSALARDGRATALFIAGIALGGVNAFFYTRSLTGIRLSVAYPTFSAGSILFVTLASVLVFSEALTLRQGLGIAAILAGVALVTA